MSTEPLHPEAMVMVHPSPDGYGSDKVFVESVLAVRESGTPVVVVLPSWGPLADEFVARGVHVRVVVTPVARKSVLTPSGFVGFARDASLCVRDGMSLLRASGGSGVFVNTVTIGVWTALGRAAGRRVVVHVHEAEMRQSRLVWAALLAPTSLAHQVIVNSHLSRQALKRGLVRRHGESAMLFNAIDDLPPTPAPPCDGRVVNMVYVGRLSERKGVHVAVAAVKRLVDEGFSPMLRLVGAVYPGYEWYEEQLRSQVSRLGIEDRVEFVGYDKDIARHLAWAHVSIVPSTGEEPFGNTAVEPILAGRPVVVAKHSGLRESASGYGAVAWHRPGDAGDLAAAVKKVVRGYESIVAGLPADRELAMARHARSTYRARLRSMLGIADQMPPAPLPGKPPRVVVAALTYRRNDQVPRLVRELRDQCEALNAECGTQVASVLLVDNNPEPVAQPLAEPLLGELDVYVHHASGGIADGRNRAIREARMMGAQAIVFIDDDESPEDGWLQQLVSSYMVHKSAGVVGPVVPEFIAKVPEWVRRGKIFHTARRPSGVVMPVAATNNLLLDLAVLNRLGLTFSPRYNHSGGSDTQLTWKLSKAGERIIWNDEARVHDQVPAKRMTAQWVIGRTYRLANGRVRLDADVNNVKGLAGRAALGAKYVAGGTARIVGGTAKTIVAAARHDHPTTWRGIRAVVRGAGMVAGAFGHVHHEYSRSANIPKPRSSEYIGRHRPVKRAS